MGSGIRSFESGSMRCRVPCRIARLLPPGARYTPLASTSIPSVASTTGIVVHLLSRFGRRLTCPACWCETTTNAIPLLGGIWRKKSSMASKPPAEAPIPTISFCNDDGDRSGEGGGAFGDNAAFTGRRVTPLCVALPLAEDVLPGVFRAAATAFSPWHDRNHGIEHEQPNQMSESMIFLNRGQARAWLFVSSSSKTRYFYQFP